MEQRACARGKIYVVVVSPRANVLPMAVRVRVVAPQAARHAIQSFWIVVWEDEASHVVVTADAEHVARLSVRDARHAASRQYFRRHAKAREHLQVFCGKI